MTQVVSYVCSPGWRRPLGLRISQERIRGFSRCGHKESLAVPGSSNNYGRPSRLHGWLVRFLLVGSLSRRALRHPPSRRFPRFQRSRHCRRNALLPRSTPPRDARPHPRRTLALRVLGLDRYPPSSSPPTLARPALGPATISLGRTSSLQVHCLQPLPHPQMAPPARGSPCPL